MTDFHDVSFPLTLGFGACGGPSRRTDIVRLASGREHRNTPHAHAVRRYDVGAGAKSIDDLKTLIRFFEARGGQRHAFRFRDPLDHQSGLPGATLGASDEIIGTGDGTRTAFQLIKTYGDVAGSSGRVISKPVDGTVMTAVDGVVSASAVDPLTGVVTFTAPPSLGAIITAGFQFDVSVRFDVGRLDISLETFATGSALNIPLIEVIDHA